MSMPEERMTSLTLDERECLRLLNKELLVVEELIRKFHARRLKWYRSAVDMQSGTLPEELDVEIMVECILREGHPLWKKNDENIVATLLLRSEWLNGSPLLSSGGRYQNIDGEPMQDEHYCRLFQELCKYVLKYDRDKLLSIGYCQVWWGLKPEQWTCRGSDLT